MRVIWQAVIISHPFENFGVVDLTGDYSLLSKELICFKSGTLVMPPCFCVERLAAVHANRTIFFRSSSDKSEGDLLH